MSWEGEGLLLTYESRETGSGPTCPLSHHLEEGPAAVVPLVSLGITAFLLLLVLLLFSPNSISSYPSHLCLIVSFVEAIDILSRARPEVSDFQDFLPYIVILLIPVSIRPSFLHSDVDVVTCLGSSPLSLESTNISTLRNDNPTCAFHVAAYIPSIGGFLLHI